MLKSEISQALYKLKSDFGPLIFTNAKRFRACLADIPIENEGKKVRNLLNVAICDMKAYSRMGPALTANNMFIIDNLVTEMNSDYMIDKDAARTVMVCIAELLGYAQPPSMAHVAVQEDETGNVVINAPIVGTFYAAPSLESEPYVKCGSRVKKGDVLYIIESMKLMNEVTSEFDGVVSEIFVKNRQAVEYGHPIMRINKEPSIDVFKTSQTIRRNYSFDDLVNGLTESLKKEDGKESFTGSVVINAPIVGTFYAAPSLESEPYVKCGSRVKKGDVLYIIESMKLMNEVTSEFDGVVSEIFVKNRQTVEYGHPIMCIKAELLGYEPHGKSPIDLPKKILTKEEADKLTGEDIVIPYGYTEIGDEAFFECKHILSINIPDSVMRIGKNAFCRCSKLTDISIPDSITRIDHGVFSFCENLISINIPNSVTSIGECAFGWCTKLTNINIPNSVISIGERAFVACYSLKSIDIPSSVTNISESAFSAGININLPANLKNTIDLKTIKIPDIFDW